MQPAFDDDGPERITRIEFEEVSPGCLQWRLWAGSKLNHVELIRPEQLAGAIDTTQMLLKDLNYGQEKSKTAGEAGPRLEDPPYPGRLGSKN